MQKPVIVVHGGAGRWRRCTGQKQRYCSSDLYWRLLLKVSGKNWDSPLIGCGTYADNEAGACSTTGIGEVALKLVLAKGAVHFCLLYVDFLLLNGNA